MDAFTHPGAADPARVDKAACTQGAFTGADSLWAWQSLTGDYWKDWPWPPSYSPTEPALKCYAGGPCP